jgi:hypothetical protein
MRLSAALVCENLFRATPDDNLIATRQIVLSKE